jgi:enoyl-CoA hydratase/carnithine racemase
MSELEHIKVTRVDDHVAMIKLDRAPNNFFDLALIRSIADAYDRFAAEGEVRCLVLGSEGKNFCAGANFAPAAERAAAPSPPDSSAPVANQLYAEGARLVAGVLPVVAAVQGAAIGGGLGLACSADFRIGSPETRLAANFAQLGFHHGFGMTVTMPAILGEQRANELLLTGRRLGGEEGHRIGLLDRLVAAHEIEAEAIRFAREIATSAPLSIRAIRATMRDGLLERFKAATDREDAEQSRLRHTEDFREGVKATAERRTAVFSGK